MVKPFSMGQQAAPEDDLEHGGTVTPPPGELERSTTQIMRKEAEAPRRLHRVSAFTPAPSFTAGTAACAFYTNYLSAFQTLMRSNIVGHNSHTQRVE